jgi:hypothetical protein
MKRIDITAILLGALAFAFFLPVAILFAGVMALVVDKAAGGISAVAGGFDLNFVFGLRRRTLLIVFIVCLPILVSWIGRKIARRRH